MRSRSHHIAVIQEYIKAHLDTVLSIEFIADHFNMSQSSLCRNFKRHCKVSLHKFILQRRMEKALLMLKEDNYTIAEVSINVGYKQPSNFTAAFIKHYGFAPSHV